MERVTAANSIHIIHPAQFQNHHPPKSQNPNPIHHQQHQWRPEQNPNPSATSRRSALFLLSSLPAILPSLTNPPPSTAFSLGIPGPKEWLKDQKKKVSRFVLAPIEDSRKSLRSAYSLLESESPILDSEEIRRLMNSASRDCVPKSRTSLVAFQAGTGVEVCTFSLILKNASSLLDKGDPVKVEAEARLLDLTRSFSDVDNVIDGSDFQLSSDREKVKEGLMDAILVLGKFEQGIKDCLGV